MCDEQPTEGSVKCPVCGIDPETENICKHLAFHGDDLRTQQVVGSKLWEMCQKEAPGFLPDYASAFFNKFREKFPSLVTSDDSAWTSGAPGLSGSYVFVWTREKNGLD